MKLTKSQLKKIIKEELDEGEVIDFPTGEYRPSEEEKVFASYVANLMSAKEELENLKNILNDRYFGGYDLEPYNEAQRLIQSLIDDETIERDIVQKPRG